MTRPICIVFATAVLFGLASKPSLALKQFQDQWFEIYLGDHEDEEFSEMAKKKAKCYICHQGRKKSNHNPYGIHLTERLTKDDKKDVEKIVAAIKEVGEMHSDPDDESSPTYDELIAEGKLPGGTLEEAKEEPKDE